MILFKTDAVFWLLNSLCKLFSLASSQWASVEKLKFQCFLFFSEENVIAFLAWHHPLSLFLFLALINFSYFPCGPLRVERCEILQCDCISGLLLRFSLNGLETVMMKSKNPESILEWRHYQIYFCPSFVYVWVCETSLLPSASTFGSHWPVSTKLGSSECQKYMIYENR